MGLRSSDHAREGAGADTAAAEAEIDPERLRKQQDACRKLMAALDGAAERSDGSNFAEEKCTVM